MMRRILTAGLMVVGLLVASGCQPAEPAMTITAKASAFPTCGGDGELAGKVTPKTATSKVVLQRTKGGKWVDWVTPQGAGETPRVQTSTVFSDGGYQLYFMVPNSTATIHIRARSDKGTAFSPGVYVTPRCF